MTDAPISPSAAVDAAQADEYRMSLDPCPHRIRIVVNGETVADSVEASILRETRHDPVYYFPKRDLRMDLLTKTQQHTHCPFKGNASYWTLEVGERVEKDLVWSYEAPYPEARPLTGMMAFYGSRVDVVYENEKPLNQVKLELADLDANPLVAWLLREAWQAATPEALVEQLCERMVAAGIPLWRLRLIIRTLHPQLYSTSYGWMRGESEVSESQVRYDILQSEAFLKSPLIPIFEGAGGVRRRLDIPNPTFDYPILEDLHGEGGTDYVAMPLQFSDGQINIITLASNRPGGFSTQDLGHIYEILPSLSRLVEVQAMRRNAVNLLDTYLGQHSGERVLKGLIKRGDGEEIFAVIWFCDLRGSTPLAESMTRAEFLGVLNQFFDCMGSAVLENGGEVLRFIGDAMLAIFPISASQAKHPPQCDLPRKACAKAITAAREAELRMSELNSAREAQGWAALDFGIGLHIGEVTYGNIGTENRLEFTVIGTAANEAARVESQCKEVGRRVVISEDFAHRFGGDLESLGQFQLRGLADPRELFTLPPVEQPAETEGQAA